MHVSPLVCIKMYVCSSPLVCIQIHLFLMLDSYKFIHILICLQFHLYGYWLKHAYPMYIYNAYPFGLTHARVYIMCCCPLCFMCVIELDMIHGPNPLSRQPCIHDSISGCVLPSNLLTHLCCVYMFNFLPTRMYL